MSQEIIVTITKANEVTVEAKGFVGKGCEAATEAIENALGGVDARNRKPEYFQHLETHRDAEQQ